MVCFFASCYKILLFISTQVSIVDECANWVVNLNKYTDTVTKQENEDGQKSDTFLERSTTRKVRAFLCSFHCLFAII